MKRIKKGFFILISLLAIQFCVHAQTAEAAAELDKIKKYYAGPELKHVAGYMLLKDKTTDKQMDKVSFEYWAMDKQIFTRMDYIEILNNDKLYVMVNNKRKTIYARPQAEIKQQASPNMFDPRQLSTLLNSKGAVATVTKVNGSNKMTLSNLLNTRFSSLVITYGNDYRILSVDAVVAAEPGNNQQSILEIRYTKIEKTSASAAPAVFSEQKYVSKNTKGKYVYTSAYQNYQKL